MTKEELIKRLQKFEWSDFECKKAQRGVSEDAYKTVSAFANTSGGYLVFGVKDENSQLDIVGVIEIDRVQNDFLSALRAGNKLNRVISVQEEMIEHEDKTLLVFYVPESPYTEKPVYLNRDIRQSFIRRGAGDERCTPTEIERFIRDASRERYDSEALEGISADGFYDEGTVRWYRNIFNTKQPGRHETLSNDDFLLEWGFVKEIGDNLVPTRAAVLLFGQGRFIRQILPRAVVDYQRIDTRFDQWTPEKRWSDRLVFEENIIQTWLGLVEKFSRMSEKSFSVDAATMRRTDDPPDYISFREAVINLLIHQDYGDHTRKPVVKFFLDRTIFWNPGDAFADNEELLEATEKEVRNPLIVGAFRRIGLSDQAGTGIRSIYRNWNDLGNTPPSVTNNKADKTFELILLKEKILTEDQILFQSNIGVHLSEEDAEVFAYACKKGKLSLLDIKAITGKTNQECRRIAEYLVTQVLLKKIDECRFEIADHLKERFDASSQKPDSTSQDSDQVSEKDDTNLVTDGKIPNEIKEENLVTSKSNILELNDQQRQILKMCEVPREMAELQEKMGFSNRTYFKKNYVAPLINNNLLRMTKPDKPTARDQKYVLTDNGLRLVASWI